MLSTNNTQYEFCIHIKSIFTHKKKKRNKKERSVASRKSNNNKRRSFPFGRKKLVILHGIYTHFSSF